jgi:hypothetical protein
MSASLDWPALCDHREVGDVVREERSLLAGARHQQGLIFLHLPALLQGADNVVTALPEPFSDRGGVVMVKNQLHAKARCWRSHRSRSERSARSAAAASSSSSSLNSAYYSTAARMSLAEIPR